MDKKKIQLTYFFHEESIYNFKFQNISIHGSKLMLYTKIAFRGDGKSPDQTAISKFSVFQLISWIY